MEFARIGSKSEEKAMDRVVKEKDNELTEDDKASMKKIVKGLRADIHAAITESDELDFAFWIQVLSAGVVLVEELLLGDSGKRKKDA